MENKLGRGGREMKGVSLAEKLIARVFQTKGIQSAYIPCKLYLKVNICPMSESVKMKLIRICLLLVEYGTETLKI